MPQLNALAKTIRLKCNQDKNNYKLFDNEKISERYKIYSGSIEDHSSVRGPNNFKLNPSPVFGRNLQIHEILKCIQTDAKSVVGIHGLEGIGKTRLAHEVAQIAHQRSLFNGGIYILDISEVEEPTHLHTIFKENGIDYILHKKTRESGDINRAMNIQNETRQILLIYDMSDKIRVNLLKLHLNQVLKQEQTKLKIKIILTFRDQPDFLP